MRVSICVLLWLALCARLTLTAAAQDDPGKAHTLAAHGVAVWSVAFSPDGRMLATASEDKAVRLWDLGTRSLRHTLLGHTDLVRSVAFSPDGRLLASAGFDGAVRLWDPATGELTAALRDSDRAFSSVFSPDGTKLVTGSAEPAARIWDLHSGEPERTLGGHEGSAWAVALSPDGRTLATGSRGKTLRLWEAQGGRLLRTLTGHDSAVNCLAFSPDGRMLASGNGDRYARLWDAETGELRLSQMGHARSIHDLRFSPTGRLLVTAAGDGRVRLWDAKTTELQRSLIGGGLCLAFSRDGSLLASGGEDGTVSLWDWESVESGAGRNQRRVDLRPQLAEWGIMPRRQGRRGACSVFVTTGTLEYALATKRGQGQHLSVEYLNWTANQVIGNKTRDRGQFFHHLLQGYEKYGICPEEEMPYLAKWDPDNEPSEAARRHAEEIKGQGFLIHWINPLQKKAGLTGEHLSQIKGVLDNGWPVAAGSHHSILLVGYVDDPNHAGGGHFIVRDSGSGGYTEPTYAFVQERVGDVFWVEAPQVAGQ